MEPNAELNSLKAEILAAVNEFKGAAQADIEALRKSFENLESKDAVAALRAQLDTLRAELRAAPREENRQEEKSIGERFVETPEFKVFAARGWHKGGVTMTVPAEILRKTTITSATVGSSTPGILVPERVGGVVKPPTRRVRVRDLIPMTTTTMNAVEFVKENVFTNAASPIAETISKAESALTFTIAYANVTTIAHWIPAAKQVLEDFAVLGSYIDTRLRDGLADKEDTEILVGDGLGLHINGIATQATAYAGTYDAASDTRLDKLNHAVAELNDLEYEPDGLVLHPADLRIIQVIKTNEGGANLGPYILGGPGAGLPPSIWNLPVATTTAMSKGKFLCGQFSGSVQGFLRHDAIVDVSTEHADYFVRNMVAIRAEERLALAVFRPAAFILGTF